MPAFPTAAQADASRANGARSRGPSTPEGKARSALNASRHNLAGPFRLLPCEDAAAYDALRAALAARHAPADEAEAHWVEEIAFAMWRQRRLRAVEAVALEAAEGGGTDEPEGGDAADPRLPSLATLARYRARLARDLRLAEEALDAARRGRPRLAAAALERGATAPRLRWLAERLEARAAAANDDSGDGHGEGTNEPEASSRPLNRAERRRLAALARKIAAGPQADRAAS